MKIRFLKKSVELMQLNEYKTDPYCEPKIVLKIKTKKFGFATGKNTEVNKQ